MPALLAPALVAACYRAACRYDVLAAKPGNVSVDSPGHGMQARDFLLSARASAPPLCAGARGVGEAVREAIAATWAAVGCNTNLGIVLLAAPLAQAA
ncbi:MAG: triphosphoribosyl-dephospho-CoA synthase, partial [Gammaproteobacteria bacterium]